MHLLAALSTITKVGSLRTIQWGQWKMQLSLTATMPLRIPFCESRGLHVVMEVLPFGPPCDYFPVLPCSRLTCFEGRRCPTSRCIRKDVMGVPWDSLLDIAWDTLASVRVSRKRERRGCFSFNVRHFQLTDCMLVHDFVLLFIHVWKWFDMFDLLFAGHGEGFVKQKLITCVWHSVGNSWVWS